MGKELIFKALRHEALTEVPWVPFAGVHAGQIKGYTAEEMLRNADYIVESLMEVNKLYMPDGLPVIFDLQVEAEILGCELLWAKDNPPSVRTHPLADTREMPCACKLPTADSGRVPMILDAMRKTKKEIGDEVALYGLVCGPFTLASHLRGSNIFMDMVMDEDYVRELLAFCTMAACRMSELYIEAGMDVIAVVDPLVSQVSPDHIDNLLADGFRTIFDYIRAKGAFSCFFVCGNATKQMEAMCKTGPDGISIDENVDLAKAKEVTDLYNIAIGGNIPLTTTMLHGTQQDNIKSVIDLLDSVTDKRNFILSPGCDMPYATPVENTIACAQAAKHPESSRELIKNYESSFEDIEVDIPDYEHSDKVIIELFLLDPDQCAACTYMLNSVADAYEEIKNISEYRVYKYFIKEDIARTRKMGIKNLPSICINGELKWISIIPNREELIAVVKDCAKKL
ncbi:MAG: uroporphyrinogen decarboxylase [Acidaminobacter sp.]|uniref:uroporphyrinogen decarboxylase family protein n=1 Tax=Acidaminobacter sp. TaxID=1872102 RepID=UPI00137EF2DC|nr:uroporphyrinogen decarboxylase family protein [Acidaminobacter sp.]MZQ97493.1 uroporphyrinogen decarboxylase [Acidaminobacter sp.]